MLSEKLKDKKIILGSKSPRREQLFKELGLDFEIQIKNDIDETIPPGLSRQESAIFPAKTKADAFPEIEKDTILITADTIVCIDEKILTKPDDFDDAVDMLRTLSNEKHQVITGVCIKTHNKEITFADTTDVYFNKLTEEEIEYYINKYKPYDKAGAYGIQEWIGYIGISKIEGSYFNVVGLPIQKIYTKLKDL